MPFAKARKTSNSAIVSISFVRYLHVVTQYTHVYLCYLVLLSVDWAAKFCFLFYRFVFSCVFFSPGGNEKMEQSTNRKLHLAFHWRSWRIYFHFSLLNFSSMFFALSSCLFCTRSKCMCVTEWRTWHSIFIHRKQSQIAFMCTRLSRRITFPSSKWNHRRTQRKEWKMQWHHTAYNNGVYGNTRNYIDWKKSIFQRPTKAIM